MVTSLLVWSSCAIASSVNAAYTIETIVRLHEHERENCLRTADDAHVDKTAPIHITSTVIHFRAVGRCWGLSADSSVTSYGSFFSSGVWVTWTSELADPSSASDTSVDRVVVPSVPMEAECLAVDKDV